jgi:Flp pilus assembly protein TadG
VCNPPGGAKKAGPRRRGAAAIEFALVAPVFFLFVLGIMEVSRGYMVVHILTDAARQGCRSAVEGGKTSAGVSDTVASTLAQQGLSGCQTTIRVNGTETELSGAQTGDEIEVQVSVPVTSVTWMPGGSFLNGNLSGRWTLTAE